MTRHPIPDAALHQHIIVLGKTRSGKSSKMRLIVEGLLLESSAEVGELARELARYRAGGREPAELADALQLVARDLPREGLPQPAKPEKLRAVLLAGVGEELRRPGLLAERALTLEFSGAQGVLTELLAELRQHLI